jgi:hypothetical protein
VERSDEERRDVSPFQREKTCFFSASLGLLNKKWSDEDQEVHYEPARVENRKRSKEQ